MRKWDMQFLHKNWTIKYLFLVAICSLMYDFPLVQLDMIVLIYCTDDLMLVIPVRWKNSGMSCFSSRLLFQCGFFNGIESFFVEDYFWKTASPPLEQSDHHSLIDKLQIFWSVPILEMWYGFHLFNILK